jgi:8-oxo-dGTP pyrophosphatase MutT (NUDIX family)
LIADRRRQKWSTPGGSREPTDRTFLDTALREAAEETADNDHDSVAVRTIFTDLQANCIVDRKSAVLTVTNKAGAAVDNGFAYFVLTRNVHHRDASCCRDLPNNSESSAWCWARVSDLQALAENNLLQGSVGRLISTLRRMSHDHGVPLA